MTTADMAASEDQRVGLSIEAAIEGAGGSVDAVAAARQLGLWTAAVHDVVAQRPPFLRGRTMSSLSDQQLSDECGYWLSEAGRIAEALGAVNGQLECAAMRLRAAQARARAAQRRSAQPTPRPPSQAAVEDAAQETVEVLGAERDVAALKVLRAHLDAARTATDTYLAGLSREVTLRGDQRRAAHMS